MICRENDNERWSCGHLFLCLSAFPTFHLPTIPRRWHTRTAPQALQRRFCVPSVTFLWEWNMKCVLEVCLGRVGCAIVLSESTTGRSRCSCNSPWAAPPRRNVCTGYSRPRCNKFVLSWAQPSPTALTTAVIAHGELQERPVGKNSHSPCADGFPPVIL